MDTTQHTPSFKKWALIGVVVVAVVVGVGVRLWSSDDEEGPIVDEEKGVEAQKVSVPIFVPEEWKDASGEVSIPEDITPPVEAVKQVQKVEGYENASSVRAFLGDDGEWYWEVRTQNGVMTVKGKAPAQ